MNHSKLSNEPLVTSVAQLLTAYLAPNNSRMLKTNFFRNCYVHHRQGVHFPHGSYLDHIAKRYVENRVFSENSGDIPKKEESIEALKLRKRLEWTPKVSSCILRCVTQFFFYSKQLIVFCGSFASGYTRFYLSRI